MKVAELLERRRQNWLELEQLCDKMAKRDVTQVDSATAARFAAVYRAVCADLALADSYQLPQNTVQYLHRLVGRAHNQLYRGSRFDPTRWIRILFHDVPQTIFGDRCVQAAFLLFWGVFIMSAWLAYSKQTWPEYAERVLGTEGIESLEEMYKNPIGASGGRGGDLDFAMAGFYIQHNTGIGLQCFSWGVLLIPGLLVTFFNAAYLGAAFGYMARPDVPEGANFFHFVTAHGPFELTAIVLSAGAGLRIGLGWIYTRGLGRIAALQKTAVNAMPIMVAAIVMFFAAALIEGFLSPSPAPYWLKATVAIVSSAMLSFYFLVLGFPAETAMQLDSTRVAIRERSFLETLDLALHVTRTYALPLLAAFWAVVLPLLLLNYALIGDLAAAEPLSEEDMESTPMLFIVRIFGLGNARYYWNLILLTFLEAPLLSVSIVGFLGPTIFKQQVSVRQMVGDVFRFFPHLAWTLLILRGIGPTWISYLLLDRNDEFSVTEGFFVPLLALTAGIIRSVRPYIVEIILLERNPLFGKSAPMTVGQRSALLHGPSSGDLFAWFLGSAAIACMLSLMLVLAAFSLCGALIGSWDPTSLKVHWLYPIALWHVAGFLAVAGFLGYINLRIRHEGWEVELLMKAEAQRLVSRW